MKALQKRIYILETANLNLSEEIKRNRELVTNYASLEKTLNNLKIELVKEQIQKQNALN